VEVHRRFVTSALVVIGTLAACHADGNATGQSLVAAHRKKIPGGTQAFRFSSFVLRPLLLRVSNFSFRLGGFAPYSRYHVLQSIS
jgi:hypothetical protein